MAAGTHSPGGPNGIIRSQSFAGFSTLQERRSRCNSFMGNSAVQKKPMSKPKKPHLSGHKASSGFRVPQPKRVEEVYRALKQGLDEYLEVYQTELEKLTSLMKDMKRNSRLVRQDQIKTIERYMRRLEFHMSKVGIYIIAEHIVLLYSLTSCLLSNQVTELKGLATHILVGSVICETKDLFTAMPQVVAVDVNDLGTIKLNLEVTWFPFDVEDLTLSSGNVSKATALQRRVSVYSQGTPETPTFQDQSFFEWHPRPSPTQHRFSFFHALRNSLLEKLRRSRSFGDLASLRPRPKSRLEVYSTLPDDVFENGGCGNSECKRLSFTFSDTSVSSLSPSLAPGQSNPEITVTPPDTNPWPQIPPREDKGVEESVRVHADVVEEESGDSGGSLVSEEVESEWERAEFQLNVGSSSLCSESKLSAVAPEDVFLDHVGSELLKPVELDTEEPGSLTRQLVRRLTSSDILPEVVGLSCAGEGSRAFLESSLEEALHSLLLRLESLGQRCRELQDLEQEVMRLEDLLKCRLPGHRSRSSSLSLTVESALESFDFLNTSDFDDDDTGDDHALHHSVFFDMEVERIGPGGQHPEARGHLSEALTEDTGVGNSVAGSPLPLTTGNENLDMAIVIHLQYCDHLIQLLSSGGSPWQRRAQLQKLSAQTQLLEELGEFSTERLGSITSAADVLPGLAERPGLMALWSECSGSGGQFHTTLDRVLKHMHHSYISPLQERHPHTTAETVIWLVVSEMVDRSELASPPPSALSQDVLTVFQFHSYVSEHSVGDMEEHLLRVAREAVFAEGLSGGDSERCLKEFEELSHTALCPQLQTLRVLASLLSHKDPQLSKAAAAYITSAASHTPFRSKAVDCYTQSLSEGGVLTQRSACAALSCLQAVESIRAVVSLCDSADEELHHIAIETLLTLGEEGRLAYEQLDTVPRELVQLGTRRGNAVTTAF
uniref:Rho family-interacting cell polarization regulator 2 n=1 Tax=Hucho hucho TaxID=62062 RepID=A0A4W5MRU0_9TELE